MNIASYARIISACAIAFTLIALISLFVAISKVALIVLASFVFLAIGAAVLLAGRVYVPDGKSFDIANSLIRRGIVVGALTWAAATICAVTGWSHNPVFAFSLSLASPLLLVIGFRCYQSAFNAYIDRELEKLGDESGANS